MRRLRPILPVLAVFGSLLAAGAAHAASYDPLGFRFSSPAYVAHESDGAAVITITRLDVTREAQIRYLTMPGSAIRGEDYTPVKDMIDFQPGQASATFTVPLVDHHMPGLAKTVNLALFGPSPIGLSTPSSAVLTILNDDPLSVASSTRSVVNPLGLLVTPPATDPLTGGQPFVDWDYGLAAVQARQLQDSHPDWARQLDVIASQPEVHRFGNWSGPEPALQVNQYLQRAALASPGTVPEFASYWVVDAKRVAGHCGSYSDPPWRAAAYHHWIQSLAQGVGEYRAIMFLEMDSLITVGCLSQHGLDVRLHELHDAIDILSQVPHLVVYLDAGAADAVPARQTASMLRRAGVSEIQGFFVNSTHFDWTSREIRYGQAISRMTGGKHFVVNTAENGRGPLVPRDRVDQGNEVLCNPPGRGLGPKPTFDTGYRYVDAFAWIANPGKSGGQCRPGAPPTGMFWPQLALELVRNADFRVR
jgi:endoglucanase